MGGRQGEGTCTDINKVPCLSWLGVECAPMPIMHAATCGSVSPTVLQLCLGDRTFKRAFRQVSWTYFGIRGQGLAPSSSKIARRTPLPTSIHDAGV